MASQYDIAQCDSDMDDEHEVIEKTALREQTVFLSRLVNAILDWFEKRYNSGETKYEYPSVVLFREDNPLEIREAYLVIEDYLNAVNVLDKNDLKLCIATSVRILGDELMNRECHEDAVYFYDLATDYANLYTAHGSMGWCYMNLQWRTSSLDKKMDYLRKALFHLQLFNRSAFSPPTGLEAIRHVQLEMQRIGMTRDDILGIANGKTIYGELRKIYMRDPLVHDHDEPIVEPPSIELWLNNVE